MIDATDPNACPHCGYDLRGDPIPQEYRDSGFYHPDSTHYSRKIGVEVRGVYDGILYWRCPQCGGAWHRFQNNHYLRQKAEQAVSDAQSE